MKSYYDLIKEKVIDFEKTLLDRYYDLGLNEVECFVLLRLYQYQNTNNNLLNVKKIQEKMSISEDALSETIIVLVNKGFISLTMDSPFEGKNSEEFSLEGAYRQLGYLFEEVETTDSDKSTSIEMKKLITLLQEKLKKMLTPLEISTVKKWFYEYKYDLDIINEEINNACKRKSPNVNIIDRTLYARTKITDDADKNDQIKEAQEIFKKIYGKK